jgi:hypothetical protein
VVTVLRSVVLVLPVAVGGSVVRVMLWVLPVAPGELPVVRVPAVVRGAMLVASRALVVLEILSGELVSVSSSSSPSPKYQEGSSTGVRKTMMQTTAAKQPAATPRSLRLCSIAPSRMARKKPLSKKKRTMLTELFTTSG